MTLTRELATGSYNQQLSYALQPSGREAWMKEVRLKEGRPAATMSATPARPDGPGAAAAPTEKCSGAERRGAARRRHTRTLFGQMIQP